MSESPPDMRVALAQIDPTVGDIDGNAAKIAEWIGRAREAGAELAIFPELCIPGYPAEDLYLKRHFLEANRRAVEELAAGVERDHRPGRLRRAGRRRRRLPPRPQLARRPRRRRRARPSTARTGCPTTPSSTSSATSSPATEPLTIEVGGERVGLTICEDCWVPGPPAQAEAEAGAKLIANPSGSPYHRGKGRERETMFAERARAYGAYFAFCNLVGGQDELVFDGQSLRRRPRRRACSPAPPSSRRSCWSARCPASEPGPLAEPLADLDEVYAALALGLRDYVDKNGFGHVGVALSGGIDSALVAMLAADAVGPERLSCVVMPSPHSSSETQEDARTIAAQPRLRADRDRDRADDGRLRAGARTACVGADAGLRARPRGREHPGADPRQPDDGALQPPRLAGPDDRQQERDVGRLRDPLRRHGGRLRGDQGRAEEARLRAGRGGATSAPGASWCRPR